MGDISSSTTRQVPRLVFKDMIKRVNAWNSSHSKPPLIVYLNVRTKKEWVTWAKYNDMKARWDKWLQNNKNKEPNFVWVVYSGTSTSTTTTKKDKLPKTPTSADQTIIYIGKSISDPIIQYRTSPEVYETKSTPYTDCELIFQIHAANTVTFESPNYYSEMSHVHVVGKHKPFGGQITKRTRTPTGYKYECMDYTRQLFGKGGFFYQNKKVSDLITIMLKEIGLPTNGIKKSSIKHPKLVINNTKRIDICHQLANLDGLQFYLSGDGIPVLREEPEPVKGYVFFSEESVSDYDLDYDASEAISGVLVFGEEDTLLYKKYNNSLIKKFGSIEEYINDSNLTTKEEAKVAADALFKEKGKVEFTGTLEIPKILNIGEGEWIIFMPPGGSRDNVKAYYVQDVKVDIADQTTTLKLLNGKPSPPSEWVYTDPESGKGICNAATSYRPVWINTDVIYNSVKDKAFVNVIVAALKAKGVSVNFWHYGPRSGTYWNFTKAPGNALIVDIAGGADAGVINEMTGKWFKTKKGTRKFVCIWMATAARISNLTWLPRAHDDNYSPGSFRGIRNPAATLRSNGYEFIEGISPGNLQPAIDFILKQAALTTSATGCPKESSATQTGLLKQIPGALGLTTAKQIFDWVNVNILYEFYKNKKYTPARVLQLKQGNCYDQSDLLVELFKGINVESYRVCDSVCSGYAHCNVKAKINGRWITADPVCSKLNQL